MHANFIDSIKDDYLGGSYAEFWLISLVSSSNLLVSLLIL